MNGMQTADDFDGLSVRSSHKQAAAAAEVRARARTIAVVSGPTYHPPRTGHGHQTSVSLFIPSAVSGASTGQHAAVCGDCRALLRQVLMI